MRLVRHSSGQSIPPGRVFAHPSLGPLTGTEPLVSNNVGPWDTVLIPDGDPILRLRTIVDLLLSPNGCPWDREQTHESLRKSLLEEAYETLDAIESGEDDALREELGDLLLQPLLHAGIARERGAFDLDSVAAAIADKLERRHPHVFGETAVSGTGEVLQNWDAIKRSEGKAAILSGVPRAMPSLSRALEISKRAARAGFEWPDMAGVWAKLDEEAAELKEALASGDPARIESETGDLLFTAVNLARWSGVDPEMALRAMLDRFSARFAAMEAEPGPPLADLPPEEWDARWKRAKLAANAEKA